MNYRFSTKVPKEEYDEFLMHVPMVPYGQRPEWGVAKSFWRPALCGLYRDEKLVAASQLLTRDLPMGFKIIYATRGFLLDYTDKEVLHRFTERPGIRQKPESLLHQDRPLYPQQTTTGAWTPPHLRKPQGRRYLHQASASRCTTISCPAFRWRCA